MNSNCGIYSITNLEDGKVYLGSSRRLHKSKTSMGREYEHFQMLKTGTHSNRHLQSAYNLHDRDTFQWEVLMYLPDDISDKDLQYWEDYFINFFDALNPKYGYNFLSSDRKEISEETRARISASAKSKPPMSEEQKIKLSIAGKGKPWSPARRAASQKSRTEEWNAKIGLSHIGKKHTEDSKAKMSANCAMKRPEVAAKVSAALKGKSWTERQRAAYENRKR